MAYFDRYKSFRQEGEVKTVPFIEIEEKSTDFYVTYHRGKDRLDIMSYNYYGDSDYGWLIMQANPEYGSLEFEIPDNTRLRIPYPLSTTLEAYNNRITDYKQKYD